MTCSGLPVRFLSSERAEERRGEEEKMDIEEMCNACARGDMDKVEYLLDMGVNVNGCNQYNRTPIQVGRCYCFEKVKQL